MFSIFVYWILLTLFSILDGTRSYILLIFIKYYSQGNSISPLVFDETDSLELSELELDDVIDKLLSLELKLVFFEIELDNLDELFESQLINNNPIPNKKNNFFINN